MTELKTKDEGWINAYYENKLDNLPLGYIKKTLISPKNVNNLRKDI